jgi:hypothetical protein
LHRAILASGPPSWRLASEEKRMVAGKKSCRARALYLLDTENLTGMPLPTEKALGDLRHAVGLATPLAAGDLVVVGASSGIGALRSGLAWPGARVVLRRGQDSADLALIGAADPAFIGRRFDTLIVGSGDGGFTGLTKNSAGRGVRVIVLARREGLARRLALAAHEVRYIDITTEPATTTAGVRCAG